MKLLPLLLLLITSSTTNADVTFDGSVNPTKAPEGLTISKPQIVINANDGKQVGGNLFHSFEKFNVNENQTVTFTSAGKTSAIANIFNRVTGNELSRIDGKLRSTIPNADLYLFNPNGVIFGEKGTLDLKGSLHISTANKIRFEDNRVFDSKPVSNELLTSAEPAAFGFLDKPADIFVNTAMSDNKTLTSSLPAGKSLDFTGGNLTFSNSNILIYNGEIRLVSLQKAGEIPISAKEITHSSPENGGTIHLSNGNFATWSADKTKLPDKFEPTVGMIFIEGNKLIMTSFAITSSSFSELSGGDIHINVGEMTLNRSPEYDGLTPTFNYVSKIQNNAYDDGNGGNTFIKTNTLNLNDASVISAESKIKTEYSGHGNGGLLEIEAKNINLTDGSQISASSNTDSGDAGKIDIKTDSLTVKNSAISVETTQSNAGDIHVNAKNLVYFLNSELTTSAASGEGNGGNININHPLFVTLNDSKIIANAAKGNGGNINIASDYFLQSTDSVIKASSDFGLQGTISINSANSNIAGSIAVLENRFIDSSNLMQEGCNHYRKNSSSFIVSSQSLVTISPDNLGTYFPVSLQDCSH